MQVEDIKNINQKSKNIIDAFSPEVRKFYDFHGLQILGSQIPIQLVQSIYNKLTKSIYDAGEYLQINDNEQVQAFEVKAKSDLPKNSNAFIVDHALTFKYNNLRSALKENPKIIQRISGMLKYSQTLKELQTKEQQQNEQTNQTEEIQIQLQFDNMELTDIQYLQFPLNTITLSLMNNQLSEQKVNQIINKLQYLNLKVLWMNQNPIENSQTLKQYVLNKTNIQIFNSKFTKNCTTWGIKYAHNRKLNYANDPFHEQVFELNLDGRNIFQIDLKILKKFKKLASLSIKQHSIQQEKQKQSILWILNQIQSLKYIYVDPAVEKWLFEKVQDQTLSVNVAHRILVNKHSLLLHPAPEQVDYQIDSIVQNIFKICGCYRLASSQQLDESSTWYVNDEVGSMIPHSDNPNIKIVPFLYAPNYKMDSEVQAFSIMWSIRNIEAGQLLYKDYLNGMKQQKQRSSRLAIWYQLPHKYYSNIIKEENQKFFQLQKNSISVLQTFYKQNAIAQRQYFAKISDDDFYFPSQHKIISDNQFVIENLKHDKFKFVDQIQQATIIWLMGAADQQQWKKYKGKYFINQFPFESSIVMKHNLADTIQSVFGNTKYLMRTYDLEKQLKQFIGDYYERQRKGEDNLWIIKPPNMARSMDMIISDNLPALIKSLQTGPKIAQKYITHPVLLKGRKIDLRYILLVKSVNPLTMFLYKHFWIRSSNNPYTTDRRALSTYQTQFTVMNYGQVSDFKQIPYKQFIKQFQQSYKPVGWSTIHEKIKKMLRNTFIAAGNKYPQMHDDKSRAVYGIDIMIDQTDMEPKLLEITFSPDCKRACKYYPTFYNDIFEALFLDTVGENIERVI